MLNLRTISLLPYLPFIPRPKGIDSVPCTPPPIPDSSIQAPSDFRTLRTYLPNAPRPACDSNKYSKTFPRTLPLTSHLFPFTAFIAFSTANDAVGIRALPIDRPSTNTYMHTYIMIVMHGIRIPLFSGEYGESDCMVNSLRLNH